MQRALIAMGMALASMTAASGMDLVVFRPLASSGLGLERILKGDPALGEASIAVAIKWRAFADAMAAHPNAVVIAPASLLVENGWIPVRQGRKGGATASSQLMITIDGTASLPGLANRTIGLAQECHRDHTGHWLNGAFPTLPQNLSTRLVARADDLTQVLGLDLAQAVVVGDAQEVTLRSRFPTATRVIARSKPLRFTIVASRIPLAGNELDTIDHLAPGTLAALDLDGFDPFTGPAEPWLARE